MPRRRRKTRSRSAMFSGSRGSARRRRASCRLSGSVASTKRSDDSMRTRNGSGRRSARRGNERNVRWRKSARRGCMLTSSSPHAAGATASAMASVRCRARALPQASGIAASDPGQSGRVPARHTRVLRTILRRTLTCQGHTRIRCMGCPSRPAKARVPALVRPRTRGPTASTVRVLLPALVRLRCTLASPHRPLRSRTCELASVV